MRRLFIFIGFQRCGTHAITNWILKQRDGHKEAELEHLSADTFFLPNQSQPVYFFNHQLINKSVIEQRGLAINLIEFPCDAMICIENGKLSDYNESLLLNDLFHGYEIIRIISLRDAWNCYASFYKKYGVVDKHISLGWEERAEEIIGLTNFLKNKFYFISYNNWFSNVEYRQQICKDLGLTFNDKGIDDVADFGNGSSFDGRDSHGNASSMSVLSRYREFENDRKFLSQLNPYTRSLSKTIFKYDKMPDE